MTDIEIIKALEDFLLKYPSIGCSRCKTCKRGVCEKAIGYNRTIEAALRGAITLGKYQKEEIERLKADKTENTIVLNATQYCGGKNERIMNYSPLKNCALGANYNDPANKEAWISLSISCATQNEDLGVSNPCKRISALKPRKAFSCSFCGETMEYEQYTYCPGCGRKIDWR